MTALHLEQIEADGTGLGAFRANAVAGRLLGVLGHQPLEFDLGPLMLEKGGAGRAEHAGEFRPRVGRAHINDPHGLDPRSRWLNAEEARGLTTLDAAPELLLRGQQEVLIKRVGRNA